MTGLWSTDWATGDIVTAGEFRKSLGCVADSTLGVAAASFDFTGLPTTYAHLRIELYARSDAAATGVNLAGRFNNDSASNYSSEVLQATATTAAATEGLASTTMRLGRMPAATAPATSFSTTIIDVAHYAGATNQKSATAFTSSREGTTSGTMFLEIEAAVWFGVAAISRVTLLPASGNFAAGSRCSVYVMGS